MFDVEEELAEADQEDALGELTNIVAGNLRTLRPEVAGGLTPPLVVCGTRFALLGSEQILSHTVSFEGAPLQLAIYRTAPEEQQRHVS